MVGKEGLLAKTFQYCGCLIYEAVTCLLKVAIEICIAKGLMSLRVLPFGKDVAIWWGEVEGR
jgi:hypothetical protein